MTAPTACQCEHAEHETGAGHAYLGVPAGQERAQYVGPICDPCATGHLSAYVIRFMAGWNMPGYMPETDPEPFADYVAACDYLANEVSRWQDDDGGDLPADVPGIYQSEIDAIEDARDDDARAPFAVHVPTPGSGMSVWVEIAERSNNTHERN